MNGDCFEKTPELAGGRYQQAEGEAVRCTLCPHECLLYPGDVGLCGVRENTGGKILISNYGRISALAVDPIEKKPLYHWRPGSGVFSVGSTGCNLRCPFCQNWRLARIDKHLPLKCMSPDDLCLEARRSNLGAIAFTYNEPVIWTEFILDCFASARCADIDVVLVTNGYARERTAKDLFRVASAVNIDLKAFTEHAYRQMGGSLTPVLKTIELAVEMGVHLEITHLVVPGINDNLKMFERMVEWIARLANDIPLHVCRYFPACVWREMPVSLDVISEYTSIAAQRLLHVYAGNTGESQNTF
ncbi:MAG: AmmeMemoRadiSam system radical SAM enzyme, partial [Synergistota bacterium]|nr:AmmeMemoRadiSam system radical SAM enzyme [Synergistota bacterium]